MKEFNLFIRFFLLYFWLCRGVLVALFFILLSGGILIAYLEQQTIFNGIYFIFVTALTIGYGDITPVSALGKIISIAMGMVGIIAMGLIIAISTMALKNTVSSVQKK